MYLLMGGNEKGISRENLYKSLILAYKFRNNTEEFLKEDLGDFKINNNFHFESNSVNLEDDNKKNNFEDIIKQQVEEIFITLNSDPQSEYITLQDFINIMTSDTEYAIDNLDFFQI